MPKKVVEISIEHHRELERCAKEQNLPLKTTIGAILDWALERIKSGDAKIAPARVEEPHQ